MKTTERKNFRETLVAVPDELKGLPHWVCYRLESRIGQEKPTKVPYDPRTGERAKADDPTTWTDFETCLAAFERGGYDGIGLEFGNGFAGVDLDHCRDSETGELQAWAADVIAHLDSYTELSPSESGVHIIVKGTLPPGRRRIGPVEMYDSARFFTVTGKHIDGTPSSVEERSKQLRELHEGLFPPETSTGRVAARPEKQADTFTDDEIIEKASSAANGERFRKLWAGNWQGYYESQSQADEALAYHLAFWTGKDASRIDHLFRQSALYRKKWDRQDYRENTISKAIAATSTTYRQPRRDRNEKLYAGLEAHRTERNHGEDSGEHGEEQRPAIRVLQKAPTCNDSKSEHNEFADFRYGQTDLGAAERFVRQHGANLRYAVETKTWHRYDGARWEPDTLNQVYQMAKQTVKSMYAELPLEADPEKRKALYKFIQKCESERSLNAIVNLAKTDPRVAISVTEFDKQPYLLNCKNGTVDLRTQELLPHRCQDLLTKQCPVVYDPNARSEAWDRFLDDCTAGDKELQSFLQRAAGYTLYGDPREQVMFMVHGPGATGKSTFLAAVMAVLGDYAATADFSAFLKKDRVSSGPSDDIANLAGARLVSSIEVDDGKHLAQGLLKQLTGGDTVRARHLYKASFEFRPQFSLWLVCNHAPQIAHDDDALWRRLLRLPFENVIPAEKRDKALRGTLTDPEHAGPAILNWLVQGCAEWYQSGLQIPSSVQIATDAYKQTSNPLADFVKDCCVLSSVVFTSVAGLRRAYDDWRSECGETCNLNRNQFAAAMRDLGCDPGVKGGTRVWMGIALRDDPEQLYLAVRRDLTFDREPAGSGARNLARSRPECPLPRQTTTAINPPVSIPFLGNLQDK